MASIAPANAAATSESAPRAGRRIDSTELALIAAILLAACGHLMIKYGLNSLPAVHDQALLRRLLGYAASPGLLAGLAVYGTGTLLWIAAVSKRDISYLYPISAVNYVILTVAGIWLFGEAVSPLRWLGIVTVMVGVAVLQTTSGRRKA